MNKNQFVDELAKLEFVNDQLLAEVTYVDFLLRSLGFSDGICTLKEAALEVLEGSD